GRGLRRAPGDDAIIGPFAGRGLDRRPMGLRPLEEAPRRGPDLEVLAPGKVLRSGVLVERALRRRAAGDGDGPGHRAGARRRLLEVDPAVEVVEIGARPRALGVVVLADLERGARAPQLDRAQPLDAHGAAGL